MRLLIIELTDRQPFSSFLHFESNFLILLFPLLNFSCSGKARLTASFLWNGVTICLWIDEVLIFFGLCGLLFWLLSRDHNAALFIQKRASILFFNVFVYVVAGPWVFYLQHSWALQVQIWVTDFNQLIVLTTFGLIHQIFSIWIVLTKKEKMLFCLAGRGFLVRRGSDCRPIFHFFGHSLILWYHLYSTSSFLLVVDCRFRFWGFEAGIFLLNRTELRLIFY